MTNAKAIEVIKSNWPPENHYALRMALDKAIKALEKLESMDSAIKALEELEAVE